jgi:hypothetical protein
VRTADLKSAITAAHCAVKRGEPGARDRLKELQAAFGGGGYGVVRTPPDATAYIGESAAPRGRQRPTKKPAWQLGPTPYSHREVELLERGESGFVVDVTCVVKEFILERFAPFTGRPARLRLRVGCGRRRSAPARTTGSRSSRRQPRRSERGTR